MIDEIYWSDENLLRDLKPFAWSYSISKTLAEKAILEFGEHHGLDVVTLIPTFVLGPFICPKLPDSISDALNLSIWYVMQFACPVFYHLLCVKCESYSHIGFAFNMR